MRSRPRYRAYAGFRGRARTKWSRGPRTTPAMHRVPAQQPVGGEAFDLVLLGDDGGLATSAEPDVRYVDSDILFVRPFTGLYDWPSADALAVFTENPNNAYTLPWHLAGPDRVRVPRVNTGIIAFRRSATDLDFLEWFLGNPRVASLRERWGFWAEQTAWAAAAASRRNHPLVSVVPDRGRGRRGAARPEAYVAAHFTSPVRGARLASVAAQLPRASAETVVAIRTVAWRPLGPAVHMCLPTSLGCSVVGSDNAEDGRV